MKLVRAVFLLGTVVESWMPVIAANAQPRVGFY